MVVFPNAKINLGLNVVAKRPDGFHDIVTCFYPVPVHDVLEIIETNAKKSSFRSSGIAIPGREEENLCMKAYQLLKKDYQLPPVEMYLHKIIPIGAGLGGGSSDAAFTLEVLNEMFQLFLDGTILEEYASRLGSDCAFFIRNKPVLAFERGDVFGSVEVTLKGKKLLLIYPDVHVSTAEAYSKIKPATPEQSVKEILEQEPIENWQNLLTNDFEESVFQLYPEVAKLKEELYKAGAVYACMSGSGSSVFGIFNEDADISSVLREYKQRWELLL
ncbi:4-(cytidine 5'-diphospho)-2-C-methyl-D-erythritol kinase [Nafulsella turpanensis]|uniref:4-(cytidine 5'-diphospho)-2-C-methyl-D-erythritol kinase n=1 Tax=Nafulsella turpanensis TaxID=1265690 RepID=UPI000348AD52|nr:4-(cytidine 5'-diphospho)-2-C-methyl-D-erythritol kinase [Nafulsella turpanensis]